jgi:protein-S-isoprenylcysteine O-methyltransferase Ste14
MANDLQSPTDQQNLTSLVTGILDDAQELFRQQAKLLRHEIKEDFRKTRQAAIPAALGLWLVVLGSILLSATAALCLHEFAGWSSSASFGVVGLVVLILGGGLFYVGMQKFASFNPLPDESAEALKENLEWIAKPK